jgi:hypothetical protein
MDARTDRLATVGFAAVLRAITPASAPAESPRPDQMTGADRRTRDQLLDYPEVRTMERRQWPRREVAWSVRLSLRHGIVIAATAVDASLHGLGVVVADPRTATGIDHGAPCTLDVCLADNGGHFSRQGHVCEVGAGRLGLVIPDALPCALVPAVDAAPTTPTSTASAKWRRGLAVVAAGLWVVILAFSR